MKLGDKNVLDDVAAIFAEPKKNSVALRAAILAALGRSEDPRVAAVVLTAYSHFEPELQPRGDRTAHAAARFGRRPCSTRLGGTRLRPIR